MCMDLVIAWKYIKQTVTEQNRETDKAKHEKFNTSLSDTKANKIYHD